MNSGSFAGRYRIFRDATLPLSLAILLMVGVLLVVLGLLLFPVNIGLIPFSPDGQLGLLLVINAIQMMSLGETPLGQYRRSWLMIIIAVGFAAMGIFSCIVPGILTDIIRILLGLLNIAGGALLLAKQRIPMVHDLIYPPAGPVETPPLLKKMQNTQTILYIVSIAFGITMLLPGLVSGLIIAGIIIINGLLLFELGSILVKVL
ncbi:MAG: hypothetical protein V1862_10175 [Methanobacteriota archaeon]